MRVASGTLTARTTTGSQVTTGIGFTPKLIVLRCNDNTADGNNASCLQAMGAASSPSAGSWQAFYSKDAAAPSSSRGSHATDATSGKCLGFTRDSTTLIFEIALTSFDSDGFTLNYSTVDGTARTIHYFVLGGDEVNAAVGTTLTRTTTGNTSVTGLGFAPSVCMFLFNRCVAGTQTETTHPMFGLGYGNASANVASIAGSLNAQATMSTRRWQSTSKCIGGYNGSGSIDIQASISSMDSGGFTLNYSNVEASALEVMYIAIGGVAQSVGNFTYPLTAISKTVTTAIDNRAIFCSSIAAGTGGFSSNIFCCGIGTGTGARMALGITDKNGGATSSAKQETNGSLIYRVRNTGGGSVLADADLSAINYPNMTFNFTTVTGNADIIMYMTLGTTNLGNFFSVL